MLGGNRSTRKISSFPTLITNYKITRDGAAAAVGEAPKGAVPQSSVRVSSDLSDQNSRLFPGFPVFFEKFPVQDMKEFSGKT